MKESTHKNCGSLDNFFEQAPVAFALLTGENFVIEAANQKMLEMWQKTTSVFGMPFLEVFTESSEEDILKKVYSEGEMHQRKNIHFVKNSESKKFDFTYSPVYGEDQEINGVSIIATEAVSQDKLDEDFLSFAIHELRTPLTSIKIYTQLLERALKKSGDQKNADFAKKIDEQIIILTDLIGNLMNSAKK